MKYDFLLENVNLGKYTTFKIGGTTKFFAMPKNNEELLKCIYFIKENNYKYYILGNGSNVLLDDHYFDGVIISLKCFNKLIINEDTCEVGAGTLLPVLSNTLLNKGYTNFAWASHIPGAVGGSIYGNAEAHKISMSDDLISIIVLKDENIIELKKEDIIFDYRQSNLTNEIIISAKFNIYKEDINLTKDNLEEWKKFRINSQPIDKKSAGSTFRNPSKEMPAGKLIEDAGLKGYLIGGAVVSEKHANFIVNENNATFNDVTSLIEYVKNKVLEKYNIELISEVKIVKWYKL